MRGTAMIVVVMMIAIIVAISINISVNLDLFSEGDGQVHKTSLQSNIYSMSHALDAAHEYREASLDYSVYQACYDILKNGGMWYIDTDEGEQGYAYLPELGSEEFYSELTSAAEENFDAYNSIGYRFLDDNTVVLPSSEIVLLPSVIGFNAEVSSPAKLMISRLADSGEVSKLLSTSDFSKEYPIQCFQLYQVATGLNPGLVSPLTQVLSQAKQEIEEAEEKCATNEECSGILEQKLTEKWEPVASENEGYAVETELLSSRAAISSRLTDGNITTLIINTVAIQKVIISKANPAKEEHYPVWNGNDISFEPLEIVYINKVSYPLTA